MAEAVTGPIARWVERALWLGAALVALKMLWPAPPAQGVGRLAPNVTLPSATSDQNIAVQPRNGRALLVEVFASWCSACRRSSDLLSTLARASRDGGFDVLAVSVDDERGAAAQAAETWPVPVPVLHDSQGAFSRAYGIRVLPTYVWIDATGKITEIAAGPPGPRDLRRWLQVKP